MKTLKNIITILVVAVILSLPAKMIHAASDGTDKAVIPTNKDQVEITLRLAPYTPQVASFEDNAPILAPVEIPEKLSPELPVVADFSDVVPQADPDVHSFAPSTPAEAEFEKITD